MRPHSRLGLAPILTSLLITGCAATAANLRPLPRVAPVTASSGPEVDWLLARLYGKRFQVSNLKSGVSDVLAKYPDSSKAHEVAGYLAILEGDSDAAFQHFLRAAADLRADATELYLWELDRGPTASEERAIASLLDDLRLLHPRAPIRDLATHRLARYRRHAGQLQESERLIRSLGFLRDYQVAGVFDNDSGKGFLTRYPPEEEAEGKLDLQKEMRGALLPIHWRHVQELDPDGMTPLGDLLSPGGVAYLLTYVESDGERDAELRLSAEDPVRVFCNDRVVLSEERVGAADFDNLVAPIHLHKGWNKLLIKSAHRDGGWSIGARMTGPGGVSISGLRSSATPAQYASDRASDSTAEPSSADPSASATRSEGRFEQIQPAARRSFVAGRLLTRSGLNQASIELMRRFLAAAPENLLARYYAALGFWSVEELGRALDLLNHGVEDSNLPGFLWRRARYYRQRQLWEKAQLDDSAAIVGAPGSRDAAIGLSQTFEGRGWPVEERRQLEKLLVRWPDETNGLIRLGDCLVKLGFLEQAEATFARARSLLPGQTTVLPRLALAAATHRGDLRGARRHLEAMRRLRPTAPWPLVEEGDLQRKAGDASAARRLYRLAIERSPDWSRPYERLAQLELESGHAEEAVRLYRLAHDRNPEDARLSEHLEFLSPNGLGYIGKFVPTEAEIEGAIAGGASVQVDKGARAALLLDHEVTEVASDGSSKRVVTLVIRALDDHGRDELMAQHLPSPGRVQLLRAFAHSKSGQRQEASSIRDNVIRFRLLEVGSTVVTQYVHYRPGMHYLPNHFIASWSFQGPNRQNESSTWVLVMPRDRALRVASQGEFESSTIDEEGYRVRTFHAAHVPPLATEPMMPPLVDLQRRVNVTTLPDWEEYVRWEMALLADAFHSTPQIVELAQRLTRDATSPAEKLDKLFHGVAVRIRYQQDYENTIAGVRPHPGPVVLERGYGDCKDKAVLLIALAREVGIDLRFAVLRTANQGRVDREVPNQQFNHAIVYLPRQPGFDAPRFLDPTAANLDIGNLPRDDQGVWSLVIDPRNGAHEFIETPRLPPEQEQVQSQIELQVRSPTEAGAHVKMVMIGATGGAARPLLRNSESARKLYESLAAHLVPGANLVKGSNRNTEDLWKPVEIEMDLEAPRWIQAQGDRYRLNLPEPMWSKDNTTLATRSTPLLLGTNNMIAETVEITLPAGYRAVYTPGAFQVENPCLHAARAVKLDGQKVHVELTVRQTCREVPVSDYPAFRDAAQSFWSQARDQVVFERSPAPTEAPAKKRGLR